MRVQAAGDAARAAQQQTLTAALLAFWHQVACFRSPAGRAAAAQLGLEAAPPLWVLLGLSVIGSTRNEGDKEQTSDVVDVLRFLSAILAAPADLGGRLSALLAATAGDAQSGADLLPTTVRAAAAGFAPQALAGRVLADCFGWQAGDKPVLRLIGAASGELGLGLRRGDSTHYYGVVNVGDAAGLRRALEGVGLAVGEDALSGSLFAAIEAPGSGLNCLIGSRRFAEGWDNYRASSLTLLRLGQGEGSLIIQMFGRWNLAFDRAAISAALAGGHYEVQGLPGQFEVHTAADLARINRLATSLVQRLLEAAERRAENRLSRYGLIPAEASGIPDSYFKEVTHGD